jgi:hypothetical protein
MNQVPVPDRNLKQWAALFVLVLLAMGAWLIRIQNQLFESGLVVPPQTASSPVAQLTPSDATLTKPAGTAPRVTLAAAGSTSATTSVSTQNLRTNMPAALSDKSHNAIEGIANKSTQVTARPLAVVPRMPEPAVARPPKAGSSAVVSPAAQ